MPYAGRYVATHASRAKQNRTAIAQTFSVVATIRRQCLARLHNIAYALHAARRDTGILNEVAGLANLPSRGRWHHICHATARGKTPPFAVTAIARSAPTHLAFLSPLSICSVFHIIYHDMRYLASWRLR